MLFNQDPQQQQQQYGTSGAFANLGKDFNDFNASRLANTGAADPMGQMQGDMMGGLRANDSPFNPDGSLRKAVEEANLRDKMQQMNLMNKSLDGALKRSYVADSYKGGMSMGRDALGAYLDNSRTQAQGLNQAAMMRY